MEWSIDLADRIAASIVPKLESINKNLENANKHSEKAKGLFGEMFKAEALEHFAEKVIDVGKELGEFFLEAADGGRTALISLTDASHGVADVRDQYEAAEREAIKLGVATGGVLDDFKRLGAAHMPLGTMEKAVAIARDLDIKTKGWGETFIKQLVTVGDKNELTNKQIQALAKSGVDSAKIYEHLGESFHVSAAQAEMLVKQGKVEAPEAVRAMMLAVTDKLGPAGKLSAEVGDGLGGAMQKMKDGFESLFAKIGQDPNFTKLTKELGSFGEGIANLDTTKLIHAFEVVAKAAEATIEAAHLWLGGKTNAVGREQGADKASWGEMLKEAARETFKLPFSDDAEKMRQAAEFHRQTHGTTHKMQSGGILTRERVVAGEAGPERMTIEPLGRQGGRDAPAVNLTVHAPITVEGGGHTPEGIRQEVETHLGENLQRLVLDLFERWASQG